MSSTAGPSTSEPASESERAPTPESANAPIPSEADDGLRRVWVLRHAKAAAESPDGTDHARPLTKRGRRQADAARVFLLEAGRLGVTLPGLVVCSSATRAVQTAELVLPALGDDVTLRVERSVYEADADELIDRLRGVPEGSRSVMLVGHNPTFAELVYLLLSHDERELQRSRIEGFPTCALAHLVTGAGSWPELVEGEARLERIFVPEV